jgi:glucokinase-like ROK family protein
MLTRHRGALDSRLIRRYNSGRLLDAVRRHGPISRAALARRAKLSAPTVSALVEDLLTRRGMLRTVGRGASSGGRRPVLLEFNAGYGYVVGVDVGSQTMRFGLADLQGRLIARCEERTPASSRDAVIDRIHEGIGPLFARARVDPAKLLAIGVGAPGMTDVDEGRVISAVNLPGWTNVPLRQILHDALAVPVAVDNDVNMAALGEMWVGCAQHESNFVFIAVGAGIGAGIIVDGRLHRGSRWFAGEIGHMNLDYRQWTTDFGEQGFLEHRARAAAIAEMGDRLGFGRDGANGSHAVFDAARKGDPEAARIVEQVAVYLGATIANIAAVLDPALVVLGGGISHAGDLLLDPIRQVASRVVLNCPEIRVTELGDDPQLYGSVYSALQLAEVELVDQL